MSQLITLKTMSSLEIVDMINERRRFNATIDKPYIELRHDNFFSKVTSVIGSDNAPKFLGTQSYGNNNTRLVYNFPLRLAPEFKAELQEMAKKDKRSLTKFIENTLEAHVNEVKKKEVQS